MNKIFTKLLKKPDKELSSRITSDTVAEHREKILAGGRRFKYPIQYARHKLVFNAIIISIFSLLVVVIVTWWQLYLVQNTSEFMYRITKVIPLPVASVDNEYVRYSDYLMKYRGSVYFLEQKEQLDIKTDDGKRQIDYIKEQSLNDAIADSYAKKLAKEMDLFVTDVELQSFLKSQRQTDNGEISEQTYNASIIDYLGWDPAEYTQSIEDKLLLQKVSYEIDDDAKNATQDVIVKIETDIDIDFESLAKSTIVHDDVTAEYHKSGLVPISNKDGGITAVAATLAINEISSSIKSTTGDGYYIIRLLEINDEQVSYEYIKIPLTTFSESLAKTIEDEKVDKYISI